jgi:hypothetical protein
MMRLGFSAMDELEGTVPEVRDCPRPSENGAAAGDSGSPGEADDRGSTQAGTTGTVPRPTAAGDSPLSDNPLPPTDAEAEALTRQGIRPGDFAARPFQLPTIRAASVPQGTACPEGTVPEVRDCPRLSEGGSGNGNTESPGDRRSTQAGTARTTPGGSGKGADNPPSPAQLIAIGLQGSKLLASIAGQIEELTGELVELAQTNEIREAFLEDRAVAVVKGTLMHLDKHFEDVGFGAWMRLIHAKYADAYRKVLDETPPVELEGTVKERVAETRTPNNPAQCKWNQGAYTMSELKKRLREEVWTPKEKHEKEWHNFWATNYGVAPP